MPRPTRWIDYQIDEDYPFLVLARQISNNAELEIFEFNDPRAALAWALYLTQAGAHFVVEVQYVLTHITIATLYFGTWFPEPIYITEDSESAIHV